MEQIGLAFYTAAGMLWKALWALIFGYIVSAAIQVLVTRKQMADVLGNRGGTQVALASAFCFISSSCSFSALAAARSIHVKGAHPANALAFLIASTNLVIELGIVLWVLVGWRFMLGNFLLGSFMILYAYLLSFFWFPEQLGEVARRHAEAQKDEKMEQSSTLSGSWRERLLSLEGWQRIADAFFMEWKMVYKEILFGFTVAGFIAVLVPQSFWNALFLVGSEGPQYAPDFVIVLANALVAPFVALFTFIGSMGNVPLAAMLWSKNASFGGVMTFLGADLVAATVIWVHAKYYGWRYALFLSALLYVCMVAAGISVHYLFAALDLMPTDRPAVDDLVRFSVDHTFYLNCAFLVVGGALLRLHFKGSRSNKKAQRNSD